MKHIVLTSSPDSDLAAKWNLFLAEAPFATHYVTPNYFVDPYVSGERFAVLAVDDDGGKITAVMSGVRDGDKLVSGMFSRPQLVFGRDVDRGAAVAALLGGVDDMSHGVSSYVELYAWEQTPPFDEHSMQARTSSSDTSVVMLDLSVGSETIFAGFSQTRRNELRKAIRQSLVDVKELETETELLEVYKIYCDWNERKGNMPEELEQMRTAVRQRDNRRVFIAKTEGRVIAASFYRFCPAGVVEYAANFSRPEYQKLRPNDMIGWHAIQWACGEGFSHFSMGGSHLFLRRFGGEIIRTFCYRRDNSRFRLHDLRDRARELGVGVYTRLPETVRSGVRNALAK